MAVEAEYVVEEKESRRSRKYPRIVEAKEVDEVFYMPFAIHVVKKMLVEERPDKKNGFPSGALDELMHYEPYYLQDKLSGNAIQVFVEFWNWKWREETLPPIYVPASWSDEKVLEFVHKLWELGRWMAKAGLETKKASRSKRKYPRIDVSWETNERIRMARCSDRKPFIIRVRKNMVVKLDPEDGLWGNGWVKPFRQLAYFEPYFLKDEIDGPILGATQVSMKFEDQSLEDPPPLFVPSEWDDETVLEFVRRLQELSKWIASA